VSEDSAPASDIPGRYGAGGAPLVTLRAAVIAAAWNLRGDATSAAFIEQAGTAFGVPPPLSPNTTMQTDTMSVAWLGPSSWLLLAGAQAPASLPSSHPLAPGAFTSTRDALNGAGGALFDVSTSRVGWTIAGAKASAVLNTGCPLDFHSRAFPIGGCAQSMFGHVGALFIRRTESDFLILVARSFSRDVWATLCAASAQYGLEVSAPEAFR
jgi:sarcosine oxidase, subunit gamma